MDVKLNELRECLTDHSFPMTRERVREAVGDTTLIYADGEESFGAVLDRIEETQFDSIGELETAIYTVLPTEAVGEPGQSEGEG